MALTMWLEQERLSFASLGPKVSEPWVALSKPQLTEGGRVDSIVPLLVGIRAAIYTHPLLGVGILAVRGQLP